MAVPCGNWWPTSRTTCATRRCRLSGRVRLWHQCGDTIDVTFRTTKVGCSGSAEVLVLAAPTHHVAGHEHGAALLRALSAQNRITIAVYDTDLTTVQTNAAPGTLDSRPVQPGARLSDVLCDQDAERIEALLRQVLETGAPVVRRNQHVSCRHDPARQHALSLSAFRLEDARGRPTGSRPCTSTTPTRYVPAVIWISPARWPSE